MAGKKFRIGPVAITNSAANYFNPPAGSGGVGVTATNQYAILRKLRIMNKTTAAATVDGYVGATGATAAGTEIFKGKTVPANGEIVEFMEMRMDVADFLVLVASANTTLVLEGEGELHVV